jgi:hypothetical protein
LGNTDTCPRPTTQASLQSESGISNQSRIAEALEEAQARSNV